MPIKPEIQEKINKKLKQKIIESEVQSEIFSNKFKKIEEQVKKSLSDRQTDEALYDLTIWALYLWVSDIHYEAYEKEVLVRFRIDWILVNIFSLTHSEYKNILERLKYSANLKLNITNIPQDGKYDLKIKLKEWEKQKKLDVRVSTLPTKYWENVVSRLLDSSKAIVNFEDLGFYWTSKRMLERAISQNSWMILVTWPTGSGKTTTLYTVLNKLNTPNKKIITLEDPIEYELPWVIQAEVDEKNGFTFSSWLKSLLRQDPDIIMVGEIRDEETAKLAVEASITGHIVFSTLHTNSATHTIQRLVNLWVDPLLISSSLKMIISQRLARKLCIHCKKSYIANEKQKNYILWEVWRYIKKRDDLKLYKACENWCEKCNYTWYSWRIWLYEILEMTDALESLLLQNASRTKLEIQAIWDGMVPIKQDWLLKVVLWETSLEEVLSVLWT